MTCSFDTMLTTVLTSFILYLIVSFLFINSKRILIVGYRTVVYICLLSILRLVLSIEFSFSVHINLNTFFSSVIFFFRQHHTFFHFFKKFSRNTPFSPLPYHKLSIKKDPQIHCDSVSKNLPLRGRCPEGAEGENLAIARNISDSRTVLSPTACGRSPLAEGAKG